MDNLRNLIQSKRTSLQEELGGNKYAKRSEIEAKRLKRIREEEEEERRRKVRHMALIALYMTFGFIVVYAGDVGRVIEAEKATCGRRRPSSANLRGCDTGSLSMSPGNPRIVNGRSY
jgi:hypothetical protein